MGKRKKCIFHFIIALALLLIYFIPGRFFVDYDSHITSLDDVSPVTASLGQIQQFLDIHRNESIVIFITPFYAHETNLVGNKEWVDGIKSLQKNYSFELGLHGNSHRLFNSRCNEFLLPQPWKIKEAREEFKSAFGYYPTIFRAPCFDLNVFDYLYVKASGMKNYGWLNHGEVYHP